jgi:hypothetical protein
MSINAYGKSMQLKKVCLPSTSKPYEEVFLSGKVEGKNICNVQVHLGLIQSSCWLIYQS